MGWLLTKLNYIINILRPMIIIAFLYVIWPCAFMCMCMRMPVCNCAFIFVCGVYFVLVLHPYYAVMCVHVFCVHECGYIYVRTHT